MAILSDSKERCGKKFGVFFVDLDPCSCLNNKLVVLIKQYVILIYVLYFWPTFPLSLLQRKYVHSYLWNKYAVTVIKALIFFRAEPQLIQLQKEYAEIQERKSSLRQATELLTDLKQLQQDCMDYREENPKETLVVSIYFACVSELFWIGPLPFFLSWTDGHFC